MPTDIEKIMLDSIRDVSIEVKQLRTEVATMRGYALGVSGLVSGIISILLGLLH